MKKRELALPMEEAKKKLNELDKHMPDSQDTICDFGRFLSPRLNPQLVPGGFILACELAIYDLQKGVDGFSRQPIRNKLVGYPPMIYALLRMEISHIASAVFPVEFAMAVKSSVQEINKKAQKA